LRLTGPAGVELAAEAALPVVGVAPAAVVEAAPAVVAALADATVVAAADVAVVAAVVEVALSLEPHAARAPPRATTARPATQRRNFVTLYLPLMNAPAPHAPGSTCST
jgi:hypothetical protein